MRMSMLGDPRYNRLSFGRTRNRANPVTIMFSTVARVESNLAGAWARIGTRAYRAMLLSVFAAAAACSSMPVQEVSDAQHRVKKAHYCALASSPLVVTATAAMVIASRAALPIAPLGSASAERRQ